MIFTLPGVPKGWQRATPVQVKGKIRMLSSKETRAQTDEIALRARLAMKGLPPYQGPVKISLCAVFPIPKAFGIEKRARAIEGEIRPTCKPDADNLVKRICDAMNGIAYKDDAQVASLSVEKFYGADPGVYVSVREL